MTVQITAASLQPILARHLALYARKRPTYQATMLTSLRGIWTGTPARLLDIGGGTGVIAQAIAELFPVGRVEAIDVVDRFCPTLTIPHAAYDGSTIPAADGAYDAATLMNVLHHVPVAARTPLLAEVRRAVVGPLYIKDHVTRGRIDDARLAAMDAIGNIPFGGMIWARYLPSTEWESLAKAAGWRIAEIAPPAPYRRGAYAALFPNRLEVAMRWEPA